MWKHRLLVVLFLFTVSTAAAFGQTESGPGEGAELEPFTVFVATGDDAGKDVDLAPQIKDKTTVFVFIQADKWARPPGQFVKVLDQEIKKSRDDVGLVAVWLTEDVEASKEYLPRAQQSMKLEQTVLTVFPKDKYGPPNWSINPEAHLTAVIADHGKSAGSFGYRSVNGTDVPAVMRKLGAKK